jgi:hypothetical protein
MSGYALARAIMGDRYACEDMASEKCLGPNFILAGLLLSLPVCAPAEQLPGQNYKTAAAELAVSVNTISFHMRRIYEKLQVHSKSEAVAKAMRDHVVR